jgi:hypothetical protein
MTNRTYQKAFTGIVLAIALSFASTLAKASPGNFEEGLLLSKTSLNGLTGQDLVGGDLAVRPVVGPIVRPVVRPIVGPVVPTIALSTDVRFSSVASQNVTAAKVAANVADGTLADRAVQLDTSSVQPVQRSSTSAPQVAQQISQAVGDTVGDTFAPLSDEELRQQLLIDPNLNIADLLQGPQAVPSSTFLTPSAYGANWGQGYVGVSGATVDNDRGLDGSASIGVGLGNAVNNVGVELAVGVISLDGFAEDGVVGFKLHKVFPEINNLAVAVGWTNPIKWGAAQIEEDTFYGVVTQRFNLQPDQANSMPLTASVGVGTGEFRSAGAIASGNNSPNLFGSVGLRVIPDVSVISSWTGSALGLGVSAAPFDAPFVVTAGVSDLTDNTVNGTQFVGSMGYSFKF